jgi:hypothetical protein
VNTKSTHIPTSFGGKNTGEVNKALYRRGEDSTVHTHIHNAHVCMYIKEGRNTSEENDHFVKQKLVGVDFPFINSQRNNSQSLFVYTCVDSRDGGCTQVSLALSRSPTSVF